MPKISALPPMTTADGDDEAPIVDDSASSTKKFTLTILKEWLQSLSAWISTTMFNWSTFVSMTAYKTSAQNSVNGNVLVVLNVEEHDQGGVYSTSTNLFTAPATGKYHISYGLYLITTTGRNSPGFYKNGAMFLVNSTLAGGTFISATGCITLSLTAGDTIGLGIRSDNAYAISTSWNATDPGTYLSIHRVG